MMKRVVLCLAALMLVLGGGVYTQAAVISAINLVTDNGVWPSVPVGYGGLGYDGFTLTVTGTPGEAVASLSLQYAFNSLFDDTTAIDLDGDGTIDFAADYFDVNGAVDAPNLPYQPWIDINDVQNTVTTIIIGAAGSSAIVEVYGNLVVLGAFSIDSFDNLSGITLTSLGFDPGGLIPGSGVVTTSEMRFGLLNTAGPGGGTSNLTSSSFSSQLQVIPEPSTFLLLLAGLLGVLGYGWHRKKTA